MGPQRRLGRGRHAPPRLAGRALRKAHAAKKAGAGPRRASVVAGPRAAPLLGHQRPQRLRVRPASAKEQPKEWARDRRPLLPSVASSVAFSASSLLAPLPHPFHPSRTPSVAPGSLGGIQGWGRLAGLQILSLSHNGITGPLPPGLAECSPTLKVWGVGRGSGVDHPRRAWSSRRAGRRAGGRQVFTFSRALIAGRSSTFRAIR